MSDVLHHDEVLDALAEALQPELADNEEVCTNPGSEHNCSFKGLYPDLLVLRRNRVRKIYEVETAESFTEDEVEQWEEYAALGFPFTLVVPVEKAIEAQELITGHDIDAEIMTYELDGSGADILFEDLSGA